MKPNQSDSYHIDKYGQKIPGVLPKHVSETYDFLYILSIYIQNRPIQAVVHSQKIHMQPDTTYAKNRTIRHSIIHRGPPDQDTARHHATILYNNAKTNTVRIISWIHKKFRHTLSIVDSFFFITGYKKVRTNQSRSGRD